MQWLIDLIREAVSRDVGLVYRGDPPSYDFTAIDFTADNAWHDLDLFAIVPPYSVAVVVRLRLNSTTPDSRIRFRRKGDAVGFSVCEARSTSPGWLACSDIVIFLDSFRFCQYRLAPVVWNNIDFIVAGWWLHRTVFH